ncbi:AI-2E family transporter [Tamlana fucoidanivorans]|uniref:AI-2E family transporter n=1 Tax=Allotamlana fucoidanivorans TaxID=2583814 RepID=A0A5C4SG13_9FLAO|nr:AI-2E family transporter [Tamlana fucoidanivorans]TNJ42508.1 AI-2E family transporter [Tamlana fucoidanivorans]
MKNNDTITTTLKTLVLLVLLVWCFTIIKPFVLIMVWGIILAISLFSVYNYFIKKAGEGNKKHITLIFALSATVVFIAPTYAISTSLANSFVDIIEGIRNHTLAIPLPSESVKQWPFIGETVFKNWSDLSSDIQNYLIKHSAFILDKIPNILSGLKGFIGTFFTFFVSFIVSIALMYNATYLKQRMLLIINKLTNNDGEEIISISSKVIKSVVKGVLLVALIQSALAFVGFRVIGIPAAGVFTFLVLVLGIIQIPVLLVMLPAIMLSFSMADTTSAIIFTIYTILVALLDNVLKPIFLGKGLKTPTILILLGTIGGMLLHGIIGLFIGPVVLAVMYRMLEYWTFGERTKV